MKYMLAMNRPLSVVLIVVYALLWPLMAAAMHAQGQSDDLRCFAFSIAANMSPDEVLQPGSTISYTLSISNTGTLPLSNVEIVALVPRHTTATSPADSGWQCAPPDGQPDRQVCRIRIPVVATSETHTSSLTLTVSATLPPNQDILVFEANATADDVVCSDCGYAWCETPIIHGSGDPDQYVFLPWIVALPSR